MLSNFFFPEWSEIVLAAALLNAEEEEVLAAIAKHKFLQFCVSPAPILCQDEGFFLQSLRAAGDHFY